MLFLRPDTTCCRVSGTPFAGDVVSFSIGGTTVSHAIGYGETLQGIVSDMHAIVNGLFSGVWATTSDRARRCGSPRSVAVRGVYDTILANV